MTPLRYRLPTWSASHSGKSRSHQTRRSDWRFVNYFRSKSPLTHLSIVKTGDARKITRDYPGFAPRGLLELNNVAKTVDPDRFKGKTGLVGLQKLVGVYLDHYLSKDGGVRMGKWGDELGEEQVYCESGREGGRCVRQRRDR